MKQDFYSEINRKEMYIRYVNKLCDLHLECDNYTEASYTLKLHSKLLHWSDAPLPPLLKSHKYPTCQTHRELKEALYYDIIDYFDKGKVRYYYLFSLIFMCSVLMGRYSSLSALIFYPWNFSAVFCEVLWSKLAKAWTLPACIWAETGSNCA
jgi:hypothetical protein